jgi:nicotinate phosphoribosyltransferase
LVTCQAQPALGCVYKLVEISGKPRMKLSQEISKVLIPGRKKVFRLTGKDERFILDIMIAHHEKDPVMGERIICRHPFIERKRAAVTPSRVEQLDALVFDGGKVMPGAQRTLDDAKQALMVQLRSIRPDILRYINPTPYKVSVSEDLFTFLHNLWQTETPVAELS